MSGMLCKPHMLIRIGRYPILIGDHIHWFPIIKQYSMFHTATPHKYC